MRLPGCAIRKPRARPTPGLWRSIRKTPRGLTGQLVELTRKISPPPEKSYRALLQLAGKGAGEDQIFWARTGLGDIAVARGDLNAALAAYHEARSVMGVFRRRPGNAGWQRDLSVSYNKVGGVQEAQGNLAGALKSYPDSLAIADSLAKSDPGNAGWQRDLSVSYNNVGGVQEAQGNLAGALKSYSDGLAIIDRRAKSDPAQWKCDLGISNERIGTVQQAQSDLKAALKSFWGQARDYLPPREIRPRQCGLAARSLGVL